MAGGGGGTGSASHVLNGVCERYLSSIEASGKVFYIVSKPTAQEMLNSTIKENYESLLSDVATKLDNNENIGIDKVKFQSEIKRATKKLEIMTEYINEIGFLKNKL